MGWDKKALPTFICKKKNIVWLNTPKFIKIYNL